MFLLSIEEARKYFSSDYERKLLPTPYAKTVNNGRLYTSADYGGSCWWWQRSPGSHQNYAAIVSYGGSVNSNGNDVDNDSCAVRVAFKINLKNL